MNKLEKLIELTQQVQALVESGDWTKAASLESRRRPLVEAFLETGPSKSEIAAAGDVFKKVVAIDARMVERIELQRRDALGELRKETGAGKAAKAYLANSVSAPRQ